LCLGVPGKVLEVRNGVAIVDINGVKREVDAFLVPEVKEGDYVIVHAGSIISIISEEDYREIVKYLREFLEAVSDEEKGSIY